MMRRPRCASAVTALFCLLLAAAGWSRPALAADPLAISYVPGNAIGWDIDAAIAQGFFKADGFDAQPVTFQNAVQSAQLLISGGVQLATGQLDPFISAVLHGPHQIAAIAAPADRPGWFLTARPGITKASDLKGKLVGTAALQVGESWLTTDWLTAQGLAPKDWALVVVGTSALKLAALEHGSIGAAVLFQPLAIQAEQMGYPTLYRYYEGKPFPPVIYYVERKWAAQNRHGLRLAHALQEAHRWLFDPHNRAAAIAVLKTFTKRGPKVLDANYDLFIGKEKLLNTDAAIDIAGVNNEIAVMTAHGAVPKGTRLAPEDYLLPKAEGGLYR